MRLDIRYATRFDYAHEVRESSNELRACPVSDDRQRLVSYRVTTTPTARVRSYVDYFGTRVDTFSVREPHQELEIVAEATVETRRPALLASSARMADLADPAFVDDHIEYLQRTEHTDWGPAIEAEARRRADPVGDDVASVVLSLHRTVGTALQYQPGSTYVGVSVDEVLARRVGVCQDFAHLVIAMCRSVGIPARYVSGYLFTVDDATGRDTDADVVHVQTHAWIEAAVPGHGWWPLDPTNRQEVSQRHVTIGRGRDYDDVAPFRGVFSGPGEHTMDVRVAMRRQSAAAAQQ